jgi:hypothetical protein
MKMVGAHRRREPGLSSTFDVLEQRRREMLLVRAMKADHAGKCHNTLGCNDFATHFEKCGGAVGRRLLPTDDAVKRDERLDARQAAIARRRARCVEVDPRRRPRG